MWAYVLMVICVVSLGVNPAAAQESPEAQSARAVAAWQAGDLNAAADGWRVLVSEGHAGGDGWYNAGAAALAAGRRGEAVLFLERALRADPSDVDAVHNLALLRTGRLATLEAGIETRAGFAEKLGARVAPTTAAWLFAATWLLTAVLLWRLRRDATGSVRLRLLVAAALVTAVTSLGLLGCSVVRHERSNEAVVVRDDAPLREGPSADFRSTQALPGGLRVRLVGRSADHVRVTLPDGGLGWLAATEAPLIGLR